MSAIPTNTFKQSLSTGQSQIGLWVGLADSYVTELLASTGYDWLLIDGEHAPNNVRSVLSQLQAAAPYPTHCVIRPVSSDVALIKQYLDVGAQTLLVPMIDNPAQAAELVAATRYPPNGCRGVGAALARASRWNAIDGYVHLADDQMCVLAQVETVTGLRALDAIAETEGIDGVFIGPADLSASMGYLGRPETLEVQNAIEAGIERIRKSGKAPGILTSDVSLAKRYLEMGALFVAVGVDVTVLNRGARHLLENFKDASAGAPVAGTY